MPHLTLDYTENLGAFDAGSALHALNQALAASGQFEEADIKSRAQRLDVYAIGTAPTGRAFIHARLAVLSGRNAEVKRELSERMLAVLRAATAGRHPGMELQLCAEIQEIDRASYAKATL